MDNRREKLIDLLRFPAQIVVGDTAVGCYVMPTHRAEAIADHLIANGVTIEKWIPVTERLPEDDTEVLAFCRDHIEKLKYRAERGRGLSFMYRDECGYWREMFSSNITHWMPLPEPPKEERK